MKILGIIFAGLVVATLYTSTVLIKSSAGTIVTNQLGASVAKNLKAFK